ncbi:MAG: hypothetical protein ACPGUX_10470, partial [Halocynthiibacter sp.]
LSETDLSEEQASDLVEALEQAALQDEASLSYTPDQPEEQPQDNDLTPEVTDAEFEDLPAAESAVDADTRRRDRSVSRILEETNSQLDNPESQNRRSAISHLRAAVAATVADRKMRRDRDQEEDIEAYRADLASAVKSESRARRVKPSEQDDNRDQNRPTPLVLVSEQRVDPDAALPQPTRQPKPRTVIPRRVQSHSSAIALDGLENIGSEVGQSILPWQNFAEFASDKSAETHADLLEAAAAWTTWIEGHQQFTRLKIIQLVADCPDCEDFDRETGLRTFGSLLRDHKILKAQRGQFRIPQTSRFHP